jgi:hypothetical protein
MIENERYTISEIEKKLCVFQENKLSKEILVPLFEKVFSGSAQFTGGTQEKGKDILIKQNDELFETQYIAIQVKKLKLTSNTQQKGSFQQLLLQLSQASSEKVIDSDIGLGVKIDRLFFVTPYSIPQNVLDNHQSAFLKATQETRFKIIDGAKLANLIKKYRPELLNLIFDTDYILKTSIKDLLKNELLMKALDVNKFRYTSEIYCDISFLIGGKFHGNKGEIKITALNEKNELRFKPEDKQKFINLNNDFSKLSKNILFDLSSLESTRLSDSEILKLREKKHAVSKNIERIKKSILIEIAEYDLLDNTVDQLLNAQQHSGNDYKETLDDIVEHSYDFTQEIRNDLSGKIQNLRNKYTKLLSENRKIADTLDNSKIPITLYSKNISEFLNEKQKNILENPPKNIRECYQTLKLTSDLARLYNLIKEFPNIFTEEKMNSHIHIARPEITLETLFQTNLNIAVIGDAGSGKTTSLQMYTRQLLEKNDDRFVVYIPLVELGSYSDINSINIVDSLVLYLNSLNIQITKKELLVYLNQGTSVLLLDSIDEGIAVYPDIIDSLSNFIKAFPRCQVITSSRAIPLQNITTPFHQISLLPFNKNQLFLFIKKWFGTDSSAPNKISTHLNKHDNLYKVVTNPLSATILCVLYENGISLPKSEASLFNTRLELLSGKFDREKGLKRLVNPSNIIIEAAKIIGFFVHKKRKRKITIQEIITTLEKNRIGECKKDRIDIIQDFLISEIMIHVTNNELSFGHLRFQEFLAAEELKNRRSIQIDRLLKDPWWHGPILMYSQTAREVDWIFNHVIRNGYTKSVLPILKAILKERSETENEVLSQRIHIALADINDELYYTDDT